MINVEKSKTKNLVHNKAYKLATLAVHCSLSPGEFA